MYVAVQRLPDTSSCKSLTDSAVFWIFLQYIIVHCTMYLTLHSFSLKLCSATFDLKTRCIVLSSKVQVCKIRCITLSNGHSTAQHSDLNTTTLEHITTIQHFIKTTVSCICTCTILYNSLPYYISQQTVQISLQYCITPNHTEWDNTILHTARQYYNNITDSLILQNNIVTLSKPVLAESRF